jgi:hypothetical protein
MAAAEHGFAAPLLLESSGCRDCLRHAMPSSRP